MANQFTGQPGNSYGGGIRTERFNAVAGVAASQTGAVSHQWVAPCKGQLDSAWFINGLVASTLGAGITVSLINLTRTKTPSSLALDSTSVGAKVITAMTSSSTADDLLFNAGDVLQLSTTTGASSAALTAGSGIQLQWHAQTVEP